MDILEEPLIPHKHVDKLLVFYLLISLVVAFAMCLIVISDILLGYLSWVLAISGFLFGGTVGYTLGRILTVTWNKRKRKAVMVMDIVGVIALITYATMRFGETWLLQQWLTGVALSALSLAILAGAFFGRILGLRKSINEIIEEKVG